MEEKDYRFTVNFIASYRVEVHAKSKEEAREIAEIDANDLFDDDVNSGYFGKADFAVIVEEDE